MNNREKKTFLKATTGEEKETISVMSVLLNSTQFSQKHRILTLKIKKRKHNKCIILFINLLMGSTEAQCLAL